MIRQEGNDPERFTISRRAKKLKTTSTTSKQTAATTPKEEQQQPQCSLSTTSSSSYSYEPPQLNTNSKWQYPIEDPYANNNWSSTQDQQPLPNWCGDPTSFYGIQELPPHSQCTPTPQPPLGPLPPYQCPSDHYVPQAECTTPLTPTHPEFLTTKEELPKEDENDKFNLLILVDAALTQWEKRNASPPLQDPPPTYLSL